MRQATRARVSTTVVVLALLASLVASGCGSRTPAPSAPQVTKTSPVANGTVPRVEPSATSRSPRNIATAPPRVPGSARSGKEPGARVRAFRPRWVTGGRVGPPHQIRPVEPKRVFHPPGHAITGPNGAVSYIPPPPTTTTVSPSSSCTATKIGTPTGTRTIELPSAPGLAAKREGDHVLVTVDPGNPPARCRPTVVTIVLDRNSPDVPPSRANYPLHGLDKQTISIRIPPELRPGPTIAAANLNIRIGLYGPAARVLVTH